MQECTFEIDNKGKCFVIEDVRGWAIRLAALITGSDIGLPCNLGITPKIRSFYNEYATDNTLGKITAEIESSIQEMAPGLGVSVSYSVQDKSTIANDIRKVIFFTIKLVDHNKPEESGTLKMELSSNSSGKIEFNDIQFV